MKTSAKPVFAARELKGSRLLRVAQRVAALVALMYVAIGAWSLYRAYFQVRNLDLSAMSPRLRPGLPAVVRVVTSGSSPVEVRLALIQGAHEAVLATLRVSAGRNSFYDPRPRQGSMTPSFTAEFLAQFQPGPAVLRATAIGRPRWFLTPKPVSQEMAVIVAPSGN